MSRGRAGGTRGAGFTLVEVLLALAIMAMLGALLLPGVNSILRSMSASDPEQIVWDTLNEAREQALTGHRPVWLQPGKDHKLLEWTDGRVSRSKALPAGCTLQLLQARTGSLVLIAGQAVETQEVPAVRFYPDGTCDSFRVQLRRDEAPSRILAVDPWTCAPIIRSDPTSR